MHQVHISPIIQQSYINHVQYSTHHTQTFYTHHTLSLLQWRPPCSPPSSLHVKREDSLWVWRLIIAMWQQFAWYHPHLKSHVRSEPNATVTADYHNVVTLCIVSSNWRNNCDSWYSQCGNTLHTEESRKKRTQRDCDGWLSRPQSAVAVVRSGQTNFPPSDQIRKQINSQPNLKDGKDTLKTAVKACWKLSLDWHVRNGISMGPCKCSWILERCVSDG